jgi:hypothetical protein
MARIGTPRWTECQSSVFGTSLAGKQEFDLKKEEDQTVRDWERGLGNEFTNEAVHAY